MGALRRTGQPEHRGWRHLNPTMARSRLNLVLSASGLSFRKIERQSRNIATIIIKFIFNFGYILKQYIFKTHHFPLISYIFYLLAMPLRKVRDAYYISTLEVLYNGVLLDVCSPVTGSMTLCWAHPQR